MWNWLKPKTDVNSPHQEVASKEPADIAPEARREFKIIAITGTSGSGRKSIALTLSEQTGIPYVKSCTTRPLRPGETADVHYHFIVESEFAAALARDEFLQTVKLERGQYGIKREELLDALGSAGSAIVVVNREGARELKKVFGSNVIRVFVYVTKEDVLQRMEKERAPEEVIREYLNNYTDQVVHKKESEFLLQNLDHMETVRKIKQFVSSLK